MFGIILILFSIFAGIFAVSFFKGFTVLERVLLGTVGGILLVHWVTFLLFLASKNLSFSFWASLAFFAFALAILAYSKGMRFPKISMPRKWLKQNFFVAIFFILLSVFFVSLYSSYILEIRSDGWYGGINSWGDGPFHFALINHFRFGAGTLEYPTFPGERLTYPFLFDFFAGVLIGPGWLDFRLALLGSAVFMSLVIALCIYALALRFGGRRVIAVLAVVLFLFGGGLGFFYFVHDVSESGKIEVVKDYTTMRDLGIHWVNVVIAYLLPQRSILLGLAVDLLVLLLFLAAIENLALAPGYLAFAGILAGLLPMVHPHSYLGIGIVAFVLVLLSFSWSWLYFFIPAGLISLPQVVWIASRVTAEKFIRYAPGWVSHASNLFDFGMFWVMNAGMVLLIGVIGFFFVTKKQRNILFALWTTFVVANLFLFQPWDWDNTKLLLFWWIGVSLAGSVVLVRSFKSGVVGKVLFFIILTLSVLSGALGLYHAYGERYQMFSKGGIDLAEWIQVNTSPDAIFLTSDEHNHPVVSVAGRRILKGFSGTLWTHGIRTAKIHEREKDVKTMLSGNMGADELLEKYDVDYLVLGPGERSQGANETYFNQVGRMVYDQSGYRVFKI